MGRGVLHRRGPSLPFSAWAPVSKGREGYSRAVCLPQLTASCSLGISFLMSCHPLPLSLWPAMASTHTRGLRVRHQVIKSANSRSSLRVHTPFSSFRILAPAPPGHNLNVISYSWSAVGFLKGSERGVEPQVLPGSAVHSALGQVLIFCPRKTLWEPLGRESGEAPDSVA